MKYRVLQLNQVRINPYLWMIWHSLIKKEVRKHEHLADEDLIGAQFRAFDDDSGELFASVKGEEVVMMVPRPFWHYATMFDYSLLPMN